MIYLKIRGRLGNQFFQYACVKNFQLQFWPNEKICIDFSDLKRLGSEDDGFVDSLKYFNVEDYNTTNKISANLFQKMLIFILKVPNAFFRLIGFKKSADKITYKFEKRLQPVLNRFGIYYMIHGFANFKKSNVKNKIFIGNFESSKYFDESKEVLKKLYTPKKDLDIKNYQMMEQIKTQESICITIRRGDFVTNNNFKKVHFVCDDKYFYDAVSLMKNKLKKPLFVVFSDDIEWVKNNMNFGCDVIYERGDDPIWEKMRLMSSCKHFIISNSTFSWWAQYLSDNEKKIVIAPKNWKNIAYMKDTSKLDIYQDDWIRI